MHRIVRLVARITDASRTAIRPRDLAEVSCRALAEILPDCSAVVFKCRSSEAALKVVCGVNPLPAWQGRDLYPHDFPLLGQALQAPNEVLERIGPPGRDEGGADPRNAGLMQTLCASVPVPGEPRYVLMFAAPYDSAEVEVRSAAIDTVRRLLSPIAATGSAGGWPTLAAVHRAKLEWEHTADTLPEIVGLLDRNGRVVRVSRAVERWRINSVRGAIGGDLHALLHRDCHDPACAIATSLAAAREQLRREPQVSFEVEDPVLALDLIVALNASGTQDGSTRRGSPRTVFTVADVSSLRCAERELKAINQHLELRVAERTGELLAANRALRQEVRQRYTAEQSLRHSKRELEALSDRLVTAQEAERKRIAQDLHDSVGQTLSAVKYSLERTQLLATRHATAEASEVLDITIGRVQRLIDDVRAISLNLRPSMLDHLGAVSAVRHLCRDWHDVYRGIDVDVDIEAQDGDIPNELATNVYRTVQEALNNIARHAAASHVAVAMHIDGGILALSVRDNGVGFNVDSETGPSFGSRGLRSLRERAERCGGCCEVSSTPGSGTTVQLKWPVAAGQAARLANASLN